MEGRAIEAATGGSLERPQEMTGQNGGRASALPLVGEIVRGEQGLV